MEQHPSRPDDPRKRADAALRRSSEGLADDPAGAAPALTELSIGPDDTEKIDEVTGHLQLL